MAIKTVRLDRSSSAEPLWRQVASLLEEEISHASAGERLRSEALLISRFGVSRVTLRKALGELESRGRISSRPGLGWFVSQAELLAEPPGLLQSFTDMARSRGLRSDAQVLEATKRRPEWDESTALRIPAGSDLFVIRRLRRLDGVPVAIDESRIPEVYLRGAIDLDWRTESLYETFARAGCKPVRADFEVHAIAATAELAATLEVKEGFPLLMASQVTFDVSGRPIELGRIIYRGDRYSFRAALTV